MRGFFDRMPAFLILATLLPLSAMVPAQAAEAASHPAPATLPAAAVNGDWTQFHHGPNGDGWNPAETGLSPVDAGGVALDWMSHNNDPAGSPVVVGPTVFDIFSHTDSSGNLVSDLVALNRSNGTQLWSVHLSSQGEETAVSAGRVFVTTMTDVEAFGTSTGTLLWKRQDGFSREPTVSNGTVYVGSADHHVYAIAAQTGSLRWSTALPGPVDSTVAVDNGMVFAVASNTRLYALNAATGRIVWSSQVGHVFGGGPAVLNGVIYVAADIQSDSGGVLIALRESNGTRLWSRAAGDDVLSVPAVDGKVVLIGAVNGDVHAFSAVTGVLRWVRNLGGEVLSSVALANGLGYVVTDDARTYALDTSTGRVVWTTTPQPCCNFATVASIAESGGEIYVGYGDAGLRAYALPGD